MDLSIILTFLIFGLPLAGFPFVIGVGFVKKNYSMYLGTSLIFISFLISLYVMFTYTVKGILVQFSFNWLPSLPAIIPMGVYADNLSMIMALMVSFVGFLIILFSVGYMKEDPNRHVFFGEMVLFTSSMLGLILASSLLMLFIFWELVGLCSYLLIGFWYYKPNAASAAKKAFIVTRVGDVFFIAGIGAAILYSSGGALSVAGLGSIHLMWQKTIVSLLLFGGAIGKSAQFPLHVWIPDAMEGPTTVSALIHAATMVTAGVYLIARTYTIFTPVSLSVVLYIGVVTIILSGLIGLVVNDIKRILAYSTIGQIGYMVAALGLGLGATSIGLSIYQLEAHAFFKALLFLAAGSILHAIMNVRDINKMGGLWKKMPITVTSMFVGALALSGFPGLAGFFSKDSIITASYGVSIFVWVLLAIGGFLTTLYAFRMFFKVALGKPRSNAAEHAHESSWIMLIPIVILAAFSVIFGIFQQGFYTFLNPASVVVSLGIAPLKLMDFIPVILMLLGMGLAYYVWGRNSTIPKTVVNGAQDFYLLVKNKFYLDVFFTNVIAERGIIGLSAVSDGFERRAIGGLVNLSGDVFENSGKILRKIQTGLARQYALIILIGLILSLLLLRIMMGV
ncbi:MAG: NADH-quinone oxidoreductase subunit L [Thermoplasmatales archaeon]|nr:NADH-quinone oxidoreductase subunit L [Thermoplasmatales archaeon]